MTGGVLRYRGWGDTLRYAHKRGFLSAPSMTRLRPADARASYIFFLVVTAPLPPCCWYKE